MPLSSPERLSPLLNADLHCHSCVSDGTLEPEALAARAKAGGVDLWALTDHDELAGQARARDAALGLGMAYLNGCEISVSFAGTTVHIVGLGFDADDVALSEGLARTRGGREARAREMAAGLAKAGIEGAYEGALPYVGNPELISRTHFARFLVERGICDDTASVFRRYLTEGKPGYVPHRWAALGDAVRWITAAGGIAVIAHPARYKFSPTEEYALFTEFKAHGGRGVEVVTGSHSAAEALRYADIAIEFDLLASRGSDFHSPNESRIDLGMLPPLPARLTPVWQALAERIQWGGLNPSHSRPLTGILMIIGAASCFAGLDTTVRYLGPFIGMALMLWLRYAMHAVAMTAWIAFSRDKTFRTANPSFQFVRGALLLFASGMAFNALKYMPVAEFTAVVMITPLLVTLLARVWLHERVSPLRWLLVAGGFIGVLIVIRPGSGLFGWAVLLAGAAALSNAVFQILTTKLAPHENPYTTNFYTGVTGMALATPMLIASAPMIGQTLSAAPPVHLGLLLAIGALGTGGHLLLIMALGKAPTATLMPFLYTQIGVAALVGWLALGAAPDGWGWIGMGVIAVCGAASAWLNVRDAASHLRPVSAVVVDTVAD